MIKMKYGVLLHMRESVSPALTKATAHVHKFRGTLGGLKGAIGGVGKLMPMALGLGVGAAGIGGAIAGVTALTDKYQDLAKVQNAIEARTGANFDQMAKLRSEMSRLAGMTIFKETEVGQAIELLGQRGLKTDTILSVLPTTVKLAAAEGSEMSLAAQTVFEGMKQFGYQFGATIELSNGRVVNAVDYLANAYFQVGNETAAGLAGIQETMVKVGLVAKETGVSPAQALSMAGALANVGFAPEESGIAMRNVIQRLSNPAGDTEAVLQQMGITRAMISRPGGGLDVIKALEELASASQRIKEHMSSTLGLKEGSWEWEQFWRTTPHFAMISAIFEQRATLPTLAMMAALGDIKEMAKNLELGDVYNGIDWATQVRMKGGVGRAQIAEAEGSMLDSMLGEQLFPMRTSMTEFFNEMKKGFIVRGIESGLIDPKQGGLSRLMADFAFTAGKTLADLVDVLRELAHTLHIAMDSGLLSGNLGLALRFSSWAIKTFNTAFDTSIDVVKGGGKAVLSKNTFVDAANKDIGGFVVRVARGIKEELAEEAGTGISAENASAWERAVKAIENAARNLEQSSKEKVQVKADEGTSITRTRSIKRETGTATRKGRKGDR